jgi:hypothetical protein
MPLFKISNTYCRLNYAGVFGSVRAGDGLMGFIKRVMHPDWYHGFGRKRPFFEGWYYKMIDAAGEQKWAVIPGVFLSDDPHAFIQVLDGNSQTALYHRYPLEAFWAADDRFEVRIEESRFTANEMGGSIRNGG